MTAKLSVLRAFRRVLRPGGRLAMLSISVAPDLSAPDHRRAVRVGPPVVDEAGATLGMLRRAGFADVRETDVTAEYLATAAAWLEHREQHRAALRVTDPAAFDQRMKDGRAAVAGIARGLLRRSLFVAVREEPAARQP